MFNIKDNWQLKTFLIRDIRDNDRKPLLVSDLNVLSTRQNKLNTKPSLKLQPANKMGCRPYYDPGQCVYIFEPIAPPQPLTHQYDLWCPALAKGQYFTLSHSHTLCTLNIHSPLLFLSGTRLQTLLISLAGQNPISCSPWVQTARGISRSSVDWGANNHFVVTIIQALFTLCLMHHEIIQTFRCNLECTEHITFVVHLQIPTEYLWYAWSTCSDMHVRLQLIIGVNGNLFWATTCAHLSLTRPHVVNGLADVTSHLPHSAKLIILKEQEQWVRFRRQNSIVKIPGNTDMSFMQQPWGSLAGLHEWDSMYWKMLEGPFLQKSSYVWDPCN